MNQRAVAQQIQIAAIARLEIHGAGGRIVGNLPGPGGGHGEPPMLRRCSTCGLVRSSWHPDAGKHLPALPSRKESDGRCLSCFKSWLRTEMYPRYRNAGLTHQQAVRRVNNVYRAQARDERRMDRQEAQQYRAYLRAGGPPLTGIEAPKRMIQLATPLTLAVLIRHQIEASLSQA